MNGCWKESRSIWSAPTRPTSSLESGVGKIANDDLNDKDGYEFLLKAFSRFHDAMASDAASYVFYATAKARVFHDAYEDAGFKSWRGPGVEKDRLVLTRTDWKYNHEPIIWGWRKDGRHRWYGDQKQTTVLSSIGSRTPKRTASATPAPNPCRSYVPDRAMHPDQRLVLDGFLGSASTLVACDQLGRTCFGVELEPKFVDVAVERYRTATKNPGDVYVIRDGQKLKYEDVKKDMPDAE